MAYTPEEVEWMRKAMGITDEPEPMKIDTAIVPSIAEVTGEHIVLENLACVDADGNEFERHGRIYVPRDIERDAGKSQINKTPYNWAVYFEQKGLSLPSFALTCNIVAALWQQKDDSEFNNLLMQYNNKGDGYGWHAQNTLVNWGSGQVIHYPSDPDFTSHGGSYNINNGKRMPLQFDRQGINDCTLKNALKHPGMEKFVKQITGLRNPEVFVEIEKYFKKPAKVWVSSSNEARAAWLGCDYFSFDLLACGNLFDSDAARGVSRSS